MLYCCHLKTPDNDVSYLEIRLQNLLFPYERNLAQPPIPMFLLLHTQSPGWHVDAVDNALTLYVQY